MVYIRRSRGKGGGGNIVGDYLEKVVLAPVLESLKPNFVKDGQLAPDTNDNPDWWITLVDGTLVDLEAKNWNPTQNQREGTLFDKLNKTWRPGAYRVIIWAHWNVARDTRKSHEYTPYRNITQALDLWTTSIGFHVQPDNFERAKIRAFEQLQGLFTNLMTWKAYGDGSHLRSPEWEPHTRVLLAQAIAQLEKTKKGWEKALGGRHEKL